MVRVSVRETVMVELRSRDMVRFWDWVWNCVRVRVKVRVYLGLGTRLGTLFLLELRTKLWTVLV